MNLKRMKSWILMIFKKKGSSEGKFHIAFYCTLLLHVGIYIYIDREKQIFPVEARHNKCFLYHCL